MMKKISIQFIIAIALFFPLVSWAQENEDIKEVQKIDFDKYSLNYNDTADIEGGTLYYLDDKLILSTYDTNNDNNVDIWLRFNENGNLDLEVLDTDFDGQADIVNKLDEQEKASVIKIPEFKVKEVVLPENPNPAPQIKPSSEIKTPERFVLNPPPSENKGGFFSWKLFFVLMLLGGGIYFAKKKGITVEDVKKIIKK